MDPSQLYKKARDLIKKDAKYSVEAYAFILAGLEFVMKQKEKPGHITGQELCQGLRDYAIDQYGPMAKTVLAHWGVKATNDFGQIVFTLVDAGLMRKQETDNQEDFANVYSFDDAFSVSYDLN